MNRNLILIGLLAVFAGCRHVSSENFPEPDKLKQAIINNIAIPFANVDTVVYKSFVGICGNSGEDALRRYYAPNLGEQPYRDSLKAHVARTMLCSSDPGFRNMKINNYVHVTLQGDAVTNSSVTIHENYTYNRKVVVVEKLFTYTLNDWQCKTINQFEYATN